MSFFTFKDSRGDKIFQEMSLPTRFRGSEWGVQCMETEVLPALWPKMFMTLTQRRGGSETRRKFMGKPSSGKVLRGRHPFIVNRLFPGQV
jgi:hypothetical protein